MKSDLLQKYLKESEYDELFYNPQSNHADTDDSRRWVGVVYWRTFLIIVVMGVTCVTVFSAYSTQIDNDDSLG